MSNNVEGIMEESAKAVSIVPEPMTAEEVISVPHASYHIIQGQWHTIQGMWDSLRKVYAEYESLRRQIAKYQDPDSN